MIKLIYCQFFLYFCVLISRAQTPCKVDGRPGCVCDTPEGLIDLTSIGNEDGKPRFTNVKGKNLDFMYSYNPCFGYSVGSTGCSKGDNVNAACQDEKFNIDQQYSCGQMSTETFILNSGSQNNELQYTGGDGGRKTAVTLVCDKTASTPILDAYDDADIYYNYKFTLTTECACPGVCGSAVGGGVAPGEAGIVLMFLFLAGVASYFIIGMFVMKFRFGKEGLEMIPNYKFWSVVLYLIKDGFMFVYLSIAGLFKKSEKITYETL